MMNQFLVELYMINYMGKSSYKHLPRIIHPTPSCFIRPEDPSGNDASNVSNLRRQIGSKSSCGPWLFQIVKEIKIRLRPSNCTNTNGLMVFPAKDSRNCMEMGLRLPSQIAIPFQQKQRDILQYITYPAKIWFR